MPDLALMIVTLRRRRQYLARLMRHLEPQLSSRVSVYTLEDQGVEKIGEKRQRMLESVVETGEPYCCFIDDDDIVAEDYCASILGALDENPDVVGFRLRYYEDGRYRGTSMHSVQSKKWSTVRQKDGTAIHYRTPNHLNPVRSWMALSIGYKPLMAGEDADFSDRLFKKYPDMKEVFINRELYYYFYRSPGHRTEGEHLPIPENAVGT